MTYGSISRARGLTPECCANWALRGDIPRPSDSKSQMRRSAYRAPIPIDRLSFGFLSGWMEEGETLRSLDAQTNTSFVAALLKGGGARAPAGVHR